MTQSLFGADSSVLIGKKSFIAHLGSFKLSSFELYYFFVAHRLAKHTSALQLGACPGYIPIDNDKCIFVFQVVNPHTFA